MATSWEQIYAAAMIPIDDIRLQEQLQISPALFNRRMSLYVTTAMPLLSRPPELLKYLKEGMEEPSYDEYEWTSTAGSMLTETTVATERIGYEICSCVVIEVLDDGRVLQTPYEVEYDSETGEVVFPVQESEGIKYELDFYTDGSFNDLSESQIRLFGQAIALVWDARFVNTWLNRQPKINDSSFETVNEANWTEKTSQAHRRLAQDFFEELKAYEQQCAYWTAIKPHNRSGVTLV